LQWTRGLERRQSEVHEKLREEVLACRDEAHLHGGFVKAEAKTLVDTFDGPPQRVGVERRSEAMRALLAMRN
jgi:hypothetical protein